MIKVKNVGSSIAILISKDLHFRRKLMPNREIPVSKEIYDELTFDSGFQTMVQNGLLLVSGVDETSETVKSDYTVLSEAEIKEIFEKGDITKFAKVIKDASPATKETITKLAVEMRVANNAFVSLINKYCDTNILEAIANQAEE